MHIVNVIASARLSIRLDLAEICHEFTNCELGRRSSSILTICARSHRMRFRQAAGPRYFVRIADTGGIRISGKYLPQDLRKLLKRVGRRIQTNVDSRVQLLDYKLVLFMVSRSMGIPLSIMKLARLPGAQVSEIDSFERVTLQCRTVPVSAAVFSSGRMLLYARRHEEDLRPALDELLPMLRNCPCERLGDLASEGMGVPSTLAISDRRDGADEAERLDGDESVASMEDIEELNNPEKRARHDNGNSNGGGCAEESLVGGLVPRAWLGVGSSSLLAAS